MITLIYTTTLLLTTLPLLTTSQVIAPNPNPPPGYEVGFATVRHYPLTLSHILPVSSRNYPIPNPQLIWNITY